MPLMSAASPQDSTGPAGAVEGAGGVVVNDEGKVLLIRHRNGTWVFPKGHIDPGEGPLDPAVREVGEEAGVAAHCPDPSVTFLTEYENAHGEQRRITWFLLRTDAAVPDMREEVFPEGAFLTPDEARERLSFEVDRELLTRVEESDLWARLRGDGPGGGGSVRFP